MCDASTAVGLGDINARGPSVAFFSNASLHKHCDWVGI
jgi:hypothetical protein